MITLSIKLSGEEIEQSVIDTAVKDQIVFGTSYMFVPFNPEDEIRNVPLKEIYDLTGIK